MSSEASTHNESPADIRREHQTFLVSGRIVFETVVALREQGDRIIDAEPNLYFDFREVTRTDSSAIVLLLVWLRKAKRAQKPIRFINPPQSMVDMAQAFDVKSFLSFSAE